MSANRTIPGVLLCALLVACTSPVAQTGPSAPPASEAPVAAAAVTPTPAPAATAEATIAPSPSPEVTPSPSPTPRRRSSRRRAPLPVYQEADLAGLTVNTFNYTPGQPEGSTIKGTAVMAVQVNGQAATVQFEETDFPIEIEAFDTVKVTEGNNVRIFGASQDFVRFWVLNSETVEEEPSDESGDESDFLWPPMGALSVDMLSEGRYGIGRGEAFIAYSVTEAAEACLWFPEFSDASLASLSGLYAIMREGQSNYSEPTVLAAYKVYNGLPVAGSRFPMPPNINKQKGSGFGRYSVLQAETETLNPAATLLKEIIRLRVEQESSGEGDEESPEE